MVPWFLRFNDAHDVHIEERNKRSSLTDDNFLTEVEEAIKGNLKLNITILSWHFPYNSRSLTL